MCLTVKSFKCEKSLLDKTSFVVTGDALGKMSIYFSSSSSWSLVNSFQGHSQEIYRIKQSPFIETSNYVASCSEDLTVKIWNVSSSIDWALVRAFSNHRYGVRAFEWLDADTLASIGIYDKVVKIWSLSSGQTKREINVPFGQVESLKLLNYKIHLAVGGALPYGINIYNINDGSLVSTLQVGYVKDLVQFRNSDLFAASYDFTIRIWNLTTNSQLNLQGHNKYVGALMQISSQILASSSDDSTIKLWNITNGQLIRTLENMGSISGYSIDVMNENNNGGGLILISGSYAQTLKLWNWTTGATLQTFQSYSSFIYSLTVIDIVQNQTQQEQTTTKTTIIQESRTIIKNL